MGDEKLAQENFTHATSGDSRPVAAMFYNDQQPDQIFYQGLAWRKLGNEQKASEIFEGLVQYGETHINDEVKIDYFAVSLPDMLIFEDDLKARNQIHCQFISALGHLGQGNTEVAVRTLSDLLEIDPSHLGAVRHLKMALNPIITFERTTINQQNEN